MESPGRVKSSFQRPASASRPHWLGFLIVWFACCGGAFAQPAQELTVTPMYGQPYPPDRLLPLRIELRNHGSAPVDGAVLIAAQSPAAAHLRVPVQVPPNAHVTLTAYGYLPVQPLSQPAAAAEGTGVVPVAIAEWRGADGAQLARNEVLARPMGAGEAQAEVAVRPASLLLAVTGTDREQSGESLLVQPFARFLAAGVPYPIEVGEAGAADLPRHRAGYDAVRAVILAATPPDSLDDGQRQALLDFLLGGGTLVLSAPVDEVDGTWLAPYMPVDIIGQREAAQIVPTDATATTAPPLKFREPIIISEAVDAGGDVLLRDRSYVHAAFRTVGMGRVVFTSFPVNALEPSDARVETLWRALLDLDGAGGEPGGGVALAGERDSLLQAMIGTPAAPWAHAAAVAGAYLLVLTLAQLLVPGARRPAAFAFTTALGVVTCVALMGFTALRRDGSTTPTAARLATVQLGADGGGVRNEFWAFLGSSDATLSLSADLRAVLRPAITRADDPPTLNQLPFATPDAGVHAGRIDRVWQASEPVGADQAMLATAQFTPQGLRVEIDNRTGESLTAPLLVWNGNYYRLPPVPTGSSDALLGEKNPPGDFTNVAVITGEEATLRGRIVKAARSLHMDAPPALLGWLDPAASGLGEPIVRFSTQPQPVRAQVLLRAPLRIRASVPGATISIPPDFMTFTGGADAGVFYDAEHREWLQSLQTGAWSLGFRAPAGIGTFKPLRATISADLSAPGHTIVLRRGQCPGGNVADNPDGPIAAEWVDVVGTRTVSIDLDPADVDASGYLWLRLNVDVTDFGSGGAIPQWKFNNLAVGLDVRVDDAEQQR